MLLRGHTLRRAAAAAVAGASGVTWATGISGGRAWSHAACSASKDQPPTEQAPTQSASPLQADAVPRSFLAPVTDAYERAYNYMYDTMVKPYAEPSRDKLLPSLPSHEVPKPTLVISLDGCIIESNWTRQHGWRYIKRPGLDAFLENLHNEYEIVLWTDAMSTADAVVDRIDPRRLIRHRLYRDTTTFSKGYHRKDMSHLNRDISKTVIIETTPEPFSLQPGNGILIKPYKFADDPKKQDDELIKLAYFLLYCSKAKIQDFPAELAKYEGQSVSRAESVGDAFMKKFKEMQATGEWKRLMRAGQPERPSTLWDVMRRRG